MDIKEQVARQNREAARSGESFREDHFARLQADFAAAFKKPEPQRASCEDCA